jgi:hypothetical protein
VDDSAFDEQNDSIQKALNQAKRKELEEKYGATFGGPGDNFSPNLESQWLHNIEEFESQHENARLISVWQYLGCPVFDSLEEVLTVRLAGEVERVLNLLGEHSINVDFLAEVPVAEKYRFLVEELMDHEIEDLHLPGWTTNFIYEEFHPNLELDAKQFAEEALWHLFDRNLDWALNSFSQDEVYDACGNAIDRVAMKTIIEQFYSRYAAFPSSKHTVVDCQILDGERATVRLTSEWKGLLSGTMEQRSCSGISVMKMKRSPYGGCDVVQANIPGFNEV